MNLKVIGVAVIVIAALVFGVWIWMATSDSKTARMFSGAMKTQVDSVEYAVEASGTNFRGYDWIDSHGRFCTAVFSNESGMSMDCDFKPSNAQVGKFNGE